MYLFLLATLASCQSCSSDYKDVTILLSKELKRRCLLGDPFIMFTMALTMLWHPCG